MTKFHHQQQEQQAPAQISAGLVARMNRVEQQTETGTPTCDESGGEISAESVDFGSVLKTVSSETPDPLPEVLAQAPATITAGETHRDRNLSSIIEMIRDEGPAGEETPPELAEDVLDITTPEKQVVDGEGGATVRPETPSVTAAGGERHSGSGLFLYAVVTLLLLAVSGLAFLTYQQMQRQGELEAKVKAAQQVLTLIDERYRALEERTAAATPVTGELVLRTELQQALEEQQRRFADELLLFTALLTPRSPVPVEPARVEEEAAAKQEPAKPFIEPAPASEPAGKAPVKVAGAGKVAAEPVVKTEKQAPVQKKKGDWVVYLLSFGSRTQADRALAKYAGQLQNAEIREAAVKGKAVYRLTVAGFASKKAALVYRGEAGRKLGLKGAWIARD